MDNKKWSEMSEEDLMDYISKSNDSDELWDIYELVEIQILDRTVANNTNSRMKVPIFKREFEDWINYMELVKKTISDRVGHITANEAKSCNAALKVALDIIKNSCAGEDESPIQIRSGFPKESCKSFLINIAITLEEILFDKRKWDELDMQLADKSAFDMKRTPTTDGFICEGCVTYLYLAKKSNINLAALNREWQGILKSPRKETVERELIGRTARMFPGFSIVNIESKNVIVTPETVQGITERAEVDIILKVSVRGSISALAEEGRQPTERKLNVMRGERGQSIDRIKTDLYVAYNEGYDKYILIANNSEQVILNVSAVMREPRSDRFDSDLTGYIGRLLKNPKGG